MLNYFIKNKLTDKIIKLVIKLKMRDEELIMIELYILY